MTRAGTRTVDHELDDNRDERAAAIGDDKRLQRDDRASSPEPHESDGDHCAYRVAAPARDVERPYRRTDRGGRSVPWWTHLLLWTASVPAAVVIVFGVARACGWFGVTQLSDLFLGNYWPVARLLPFVALAIAILVQAGVMGVGMCTSRVCREMRHETSFQSQSRPDPS